MTQDVLRWLKRVTFFGGGTAERIRVLILRSVHRDGWANRTFVGYARLGPKVDSEEFRLPLNEAANGADSRIAERAKHVLRVLASRKTS